MLRYANKYERDTRAIPTGTENTTISAVVTVMEFSVGMRGYLAQVGKHPDARSSSCRVDSSETALRCTVFENPYARIPLPEDLPGSLFRGAYDERFGAVGAHIRRKFAGEGWLELESLDGKRSDFAQRP